MSVGVDIIDSEHKKLISILNDLHDAIIADNVKQGLEVFFADAINYCDYHFSHEEAIFLGTDYPDKAAHIAAHQTMKKYLMESRNKFEQGQMNDFPEELMVFLKGWLVNHIQETDMKYVPYLRHPKV